jgi:hypothetical protein
MTNLNIKVPDAPFQSLLVRVEEYVETIPANCATPVEDLYGLTVLVARDDHFGSKRISSVSSHKAVALGDFVA